MILVDRIVVGNDLHHDLSAQEVNPVTAEAAEEKEQKPKRKKVKADADA